MKRMVLLVPLVLWFAGSVGATAPTYFVLHTLEGETAADNLGVSVAGAGDVDGDGYDDLIVGEPSGTTRVFSGLDGSVLHAFTGDSSGDQFGASVAGVGDVNGDGYDDLLVGAFQADHGAADAGSAYLLSGLDGSLLHRFDGTSASEDFGMAVAGAGDVDGDGTPDVIVGAPRADGGTTNGGAAFVFSGDDYSEIHAFEGTANGGQFGRSVAGAGDVDGDGKADLVVGAYFQSNGGKTWCGTVRVYAGDDGALLHTFHGDSAFDFLGYSVAGAQDVDGDGYDDVVAGAYGDDDNGGFSGSARVYSGLDGTILHTFYGSSAGQFLGLSVAGAGDVDGDGHADVIAGAPGPFGSATEAGSATVWSGADGSVLLTFAGDAAGDEFGYSVAGAGDVLGDGSAALIVGARNADPNGAGSGLARVFARDADVVPPEIACPGDLTVEATGASGATVTFGGATATDDRTASPTITYSPASGSTFPVGTTTVTVTAEDEAGNTSTCSFDVVVEDTTPPAITCPGGLTVEAAGASGTAVAFTGATAATATDNCTAAPTITYSPASGSTFPMGTTTVTVTAVDEAGNTATCTFDVIVGDTTPPEITAISVDPASLWPPDNKMRSTAVTVTSSDAVGVQDCTIVDVTSDEAEGKDADIDVTGDLTVDLRAQRDGGGDGRVYTITVRCRDAAGNAAESAVTVTVPHDKGR